MAWSASFGLFEPSDSVLLALKAKVGTRAEAPRAELEFGGARPPSGRADVLIADVERRCANAAASAWRAELPAPPSKQKALAEALGAGRPPPRDQESPTRNSEMRRPRQPRGDEASPFAAPIIANPPQQKSRPKPVAGAGHTPSSSSSAVLPRPSSHGAEHRRGQVGRRARPTPEDILVEALNVGSATPSPAAHPATSSASLPQSRSRADPSELLRPPRPRVLDEHSSHPPSAVAQAADAALASALAHLGVDKEPLDDMPQPSPSPISHSISEIGDESSEVDVACQHIPSVVTFGGQPVAMDGDLIYLGGGLYASAAPPPPEQSKAPRAKVMPGRVRPGPRIPVGQARGAISRSASSPPLERAQSDVASEKASEKGSQAPRVWRPAGASKLPPPAPAEISSARRQWANLDDIVDGGAYSEARARERDSVKHGGPNLFGPRGLLGEMARVPEGPASGRASNGPPTNSIVRAEERRMMREARVEAIMTEKARQEEVEKLKSEALHERLKAETLENRMLSRRSPGSASAPALAFSAAPAPALCSARSGPESPANQPKGELDKQRLRVACKMEMIDFFSGYAKNVSRMNAEQTKALLAQLHGGLKLTDAPSQPTNQSPEEHAIAVESPLPTPSGAAEPSLPTPIQGESKPDVETHESDRPTYLDWPNEYCEPSPQGVDQSVKGRLQQVNDNCNKAFDSIRLEDEGF